MPKKTSKPDLQYISKLKNKTKIDIDRDPDYIFDDSDTDEESDEESTSDSESDDDQNTNVLTVTDVNTMVSNVFATELSGTIAVTGEISNLRISRNHLWMTIKDKSSEIGVHCWNYGRRTNNPVMDNGDKIIVMGVLCPFQKKGTYSIRGFKFVPVGAGDIHTEYEKLRIECQKKGYFDPKHKKPLPTHIRKIGLITALQGAAINDFMYVLNDKGYTGTIYKKGCSVQGRLCPTSVVSAIQALDKLKLDVIVVTRGGGSFEDLMGFSNINVIKAIYKAKTCIISAIGHEVDTMLSDLVADIRAPTPTAAAKVICDHQQDKFDVIPYKMYLNKLGMDIMNTLSMYRMQLQTLKDSMIQKAPEKIVDSGYAILSYKGKVVNSVSRLRELRKKGTKLLKLQVSDGYIYIDTNHIKIYNNK